MPVLSLHLKGEEIINRQARRLSYDKRAHNGIQTAKIRQKKKLTQKKLAKQLHTTQQTISRLENIHNKSYSLQTLIKLARILDKRVSVKFSDVVKK